MYRYLMLAICLCLLLNSTAKAGVMLTLEGLPSTYVPNSSFSFDVRLVDAQDLKSFNIDLILLAAHGTAGIDFFFDDILTTEPANRYVFDPAVNSVNPVGFFASAGVNGNNATLNLSDFLDVGETVSTVAGVNDLVATVTVTTIGNVGSLSIGFDTEYLFLDSLASPIADLDDLIGTLDSTPPANIAAVPEPSMLSIFAAGGSVCMLAVRRRRKGSRTAT